MKCRCLDPLVFSDEPGHCVRCGRSVQRKRRSRARDQRPRHAVPAERRRPLPRDLGAIQREGKRISPELDNVVRLDNLRAQHDARRAA